MTQTKIDVRIADQALWAGSARVPLMGGEVHYWRLAPEVWRPALERVKQLGVEVLATYVCWDFHEIAPGRFDFTGQTDPRRNLAGFLDLLTEMGFWIIIRPGPYIYAEWANAGVPEYAAAYHRMDPRYLAAARRYLEAVVPVIAPYFATHGGRILLCQAENETDCWPHMYTEALGLGAQPGLYQAFLQERYAEIEQLNAAWGARYPAFDQARAILSLPPGRRDWLPRYLDFYRFKHWYVARAIRWTVDTLRELGVDIPLYTNTIAVHANEPWAEMERISGLNGTDLYPSNGFRKPEEHRKYLEAVRYLRTYSALPYIAEFEAGIWHGAHLESENGALLPAHYRMAAVSALMAGAVGWNWYMLVNRDNWYMAPVNEWGRARTDVYRVFAQITELYRRIDPPGLEKLTDLAATIDPLQQATAHAENGVLQALYRAGLDYDFFDVNTGCEARPLLFYAGDEWLDEAGQRRLLDYVENGGHLLCVGAAPRLDSRLRPLDGLALPEAAGVIGDMGEIGLDLLLPGGPRTVKTRWLEWFAQVPGEPLFALRRPVDEDAIEEMQYLCSLPAGDRYCCGFSRGLGKGKISYLGLQPTPELLLGLCAAFGDPPPVRSTTTGVSCALLRPKAGGEAKAAYYLMIVNTGSEEKGVELIFRPGLLGSGPVTFRDVLSDRVFQAVPADPVYLPVAGKDGAVYAVQLSKSALPGG